MIDDDRYTLFHLSFVCQRYFQSQSVISQFVLSLNVKENDTKNKKNESNWRRPNKEQKPASFNLIEMYVIIASIDGSYPFNFDRLNLHWTEIVRKYQQQWVACDVKNTLYDQIKNNKKHYASIHHVNECNPVWR